jgi:hypothetical protein
MDFGLYGNGNSMAFISAKGLCVLSFFMGRNELKAEGRLLVRATLYHKHPIYLKHVLLSPVKTVHA